jgi:hypothetical protein
MVLGLLGILWLLLLQTLQTTQRLLLEWLKQSWGRSEKSGKPITPGK